MKSEAGPVQPKRQRTVLLVEDDADFLKLLAKQFEGEGFRTRTASNGAEAITIMNGIDMLDINLIVSDVEMMRGSGLELLRVIRLRGIEIPFFFLTANGMNEQQAIRMGANGLFHKSPSPNVAVEIIRSLDSKKSH